MLGLCYSADGRRLLAGHDRSGIVQVWDAASGKQLTTIETGPRQLSFREFFQLSPDGQSLYVNHGTGRVRFIVEKDKRFYRFDFSGTLRVWDVASGKPRHDFPLAPRRGVSTMQLSPDGSRLLTGEVLSGDYESSRGKHFTTLWDTRKAVSVGTIPDTATSAYLVFSPDSKTLLTHAVNDKGETAALLFLDAASGKVRRSIPLEQKPRKVLHRAFSPDGKQLACDVVNATSREHWLKVWDATSAREIASFEGAKNDHFRQPVFSPDGRMLAVTTMLSKEKKLYLIDVRKQQLIKIVSLDDRNPLNRRPIFSPDSKWVAIISQALPVNRSPLFLKPDEVPQPRILLVEAATGEVRETIVAPPGIPLSLCFSPDGKTLASGGDGRLLLWDMTSLPGARSQPRE